MIKQALSSFYTKQKHTVGCFSFHRFSRLLCFIRLLSLSLLYILFFASSSPYLLRFDGDDLLTSVLFSCSSSFFRRHLALCVHSVQLSFSSILESLSFFFVLNKNDDQLVD